MGAPSEPWPLVTLRPATVTGAPLAHCSSTDIGPDALSSATYTYIHDGCPSYTNTSPASFPLSSVSLPASSALPPSTRSALTYSRSSDVPRLRSYSPVKPMATPRTHAATAITVSRRRRRGPLDVRPRPAPTMRSVTRVSNPSGGSACGARSRSESATSASASTSARHVWHAARCSRAAARSAPDTMPRANSAAASRTCSQVMVGSVTVAVPVDGSKRAAQLDHGGADARLGRPQRDRLGVADLLRREAADRRQHHRAALVDRELGQRPPEAVGVFVGRRRVGRRRLRALELEGNDGIGLHGLGPAHPHRVDGEVAGDGEQPGGHRRSAGVVVGGVTPRAHE